MLITSTILVVLFVLGALARKEDSRHHAGAHDRHSDSDSSSDESSSRSGFLGGDDETSVEIQLDFSRRLQAALDAPGALNTDLTSSSPSSVQREQLRDQFRFEKIEKALEAAAAKVAHRKASSFSYQAVFSRNTSQVCIAKAGQITFPNSTTATAFDLSNLTTCATHEGGPVVFIAKSTGPVQADSFDGNHDGVDDVLGAVNKFAASQGSPKISEAAAISALTLEIRNRATVNGGSINLHSIIITGRQATQGSPFATFGGLSNKILISPCFPVRNDIPGYNFQFFGVVSKGVWKGFFDVQNAAQGPITYSDFVKTAGSPDVLLPQTLPFNLVMSAFPNPGLGGGTVGAGVLFGSVFFQQCTQFSYFT